MWYWFGYKKKITSNTVLTLAFKSCEYPYLRLLCDVISIILNEYLQQQQEFVTRKS